MHEHHRDLISELTRLGLSPRLSHTNGTHVRIEWNVAGKEQHIVTSATPSDRRSTLNARARIRRQLKDAGFYKALEKKPKPAVIETDGASLLHTLAARVTQLELDIITLLDIAETSCEPEVTPALEPEPALPPVIVAKKKCRSKLLFFIPVDHWSTLPEIIKQSGRSKNVVSVALTYFKKQGLVDHDRENHRWRKRVECLL